MSEYETSTRTNTLAIASLICGVVWMMGLGSIAAVILSRMASSQIDQTGEQGRGLAQAGLILGCVGIAFTALMWSGTLFAMFRGNSYGY